MLSEQLNSLLQKLRYKGIGLRVLVWWSGQGALLPTSIRCHLLLLVLLKLPIVLALLDGLALQVAQELLHCVLLVGVVVSEVKPLDVGQVTGVARFVYEVENDLNLHLNDALGRDIDHEDAVELGY